MRYVRRLVVLSALIGLAACSKYPTSTQKFRAYNGPEVTSVVVYKEKRRMYLMHDGKVLKKYRVGLGFSPDGHKIKEGDGRTPEGQYFIDRRNPNSRYHLSLGISYPNANDRARAAAAGVSPGGEIFIHGRPLDVPKHLIDWTLGCIAVNDPEMEEIYAMVDNGTPIWIHE